MSKENRDKIEKSRARIAKEMQADVRFQSYFTPYQKSSVTEFLKRYAWYKANLEVYGDYTKDHHERLIYQYHEDAWAALKDIQMKKLFDMECLWRAEQETDMSGVEVTKDFRNVFHTILDYPDIPIISSEDIELYQLFLHREQHVIYYIQGYVQYPDYEDVKTAYEEESETGIEYVDFHNKQTGNHSLLLLPDIRGQKEKMYIEMFVDKAKKDTVQEEDSKAEKQHLSAMDEELIKFGAHFGDKKTVNFIKDQRKWLRETIDPIFSWAFRYLGDLNPEKVPIKAHEDWKEAVYFTAVHHKSKLVAEILPTVYEEYLLKKNLGSPLTTEEKENYSLSFNNWWKESILAGREINGEPRDFNF